MGHDALWKRWSERARRAAGVVLARYVLFDCALEPWVCATGPVRVLATRGAVAIDRKVVFCGGLVPTELSASGEARIRIGESSVINYGAQIDARDADVSIGRRCLIASGVRILARGERPTCIADDVWIAHGAVVESGVSIGAGSVISAGTVVTEDVPPASLVIGTPARAMPLQLMAERDASVTRASPDASTRARSDTVVQNQRSG
jgi:carbonic anhydrase/acetyltransferase-like protein (isoleucine patch superfamily)